MRVIWSTYIAYVSAWKCVLPDIWVRHYNWPFNQVNFTIVVTLLFSFVGTFLQIFCSAKGYKMSNSKFVCLPLFFAHQAVVFTHFGIKFIFGQNTDFQINNFVPSISRDRSWLNCTIESFLNWSFNLRSWIVHSFLREQC